MNVLSLFDGLSGCRVALERIGITPFKYYASEIDKYAITVAQANYPDTVQLGSVTDWDSWDIDWASIDLVTGGFPCQAWSVAGRQQGDKDERGMLFWTMLDVMKQVMSANPNAKFLIENVKMKKEFEQYITHHTEQALGEVHKTLINSALVSAQNRNRYYWTNFPVSQPKDLGIVLADIIEDGIATSEITTKTGKSYVLTANYAGAVAWNSSAKKQGSMILERPCEPKSFSPDSLCHHAADATDIKGNESIKRVYATTGKAPTLTTMGGGHREPKIINIDKLTYRKLTPLECERLQTLPDNYTNHVSNTQRYKMIGNGWTINVIAHILRKRFV